ncbi:MAG TPA: nucleoside-diphosphate kinase [Candidatus Paceibacterota bacterium]
MVNPKEEKTFLLVKPDGVRKGLIGEIIQRFERRDLKIVALEMFEATKEQINEHYPKDEVWIRRVGEKTLATLHKYQKDPKELLGTEDSFEIGKMIRQWTIDFMVSAPLVRMVIQGIHAVDVVRKIVGPTMPYLAEMGTIRGDFSADSPLLANSEKRAVANLVHASETPQEAEHEIQFWFGDRLIFNYKRFGLDE